MLDRITAAFEGWGYWGVALAMLLENVFPPIPSEAVLPAAGMAARRGVLSVWGVIAAGSVGSLLGATFWYGVGRRVGRDRLIAWADGWGRYLGFRSNDVRRAEAWFDRHGGRAVLIGRLIPGVRTLVSVPAGVSAMPFGRFLAWSAVGTAGWTTFLTLVGWWLGRSAAVVEQVVSWVGIAVIVWLIAWVGRRAWAAWRERARAGAETDAGRPEAHPRKIPDRRPRSERLERDAVGGGFGRRPAGA